MLNNNNRRAIVYQFLENVNQNLNIQRMQTDGRLIKHENAVFLPASHFRSQLQTLGFPAGKTWRGFAKRQIPQSQIFQRLQTLPDDF